MGKRMSTHTYSITEETCGEMKYPTCWIVKRDDRNWGDHFDTEAEAQQGKTELEADDNWIAALVAEHKSR